MPRCKAPTIPLVGDDASHPEYVLGGYRLIDLLARGGTAHVYLAEAPDGARVAIKVLDPTYAGEPAVVAGFLAEPEVAKAAGHPGLLAVHSVGRADDSQLPYVVMELLDGETLQTVIDRIDLPLGAIVSIGEQVAAAIAALHDAGYIHCDIKPANVFVLYDTIDGHPQVKVIDYGVARPVGQVEDGDVISGTPSYMAPEQWRGAPTSKSDVYALGCMLHELVTGEPLFSGTLPQLAIAHCEAMPPRPSQLCKTALDPRLERLIVRAIAKDPELRPTMADLARELARIVPVVELDVALADFAADALANVEAAG